MKIKDLVVREKGKSSIWLPDLPFFLSPSVSFRPFAAICKTLKTLLRVSSHSHILLKLASVSLVWHSRGQCWKTKLKKTKELAAEFANGSALAVIVYDFVLFNSTYFWIFSLKSKKMRQNSSKSLNEKLVQWTKHQHQKKHSQIHDNLYF